MPDLAQTNVQLCRQLVDLGWDDDALARLRGAYVLAMELFSGQFRANGKTQIAHHVGVASALAEIGARPDVVLAGLVHSTYFLGEFGDGRPGFNPHKQPRVRTAVGDEVEALVAEYAELEWNGPAVQTLLRDCEHLSPTVRDVVVMRLANEIDERADATSRFTTDAGEPGLEGDEGRALLDDLAGRVGGDALRDRLRAAEAQGDATKVPEVLVSSETETVFGHPASYRRRLHIALQDSRLGHEVAERVPGARKLAERVRRVVS